MNNEPVVHFTLAGRSFELRRSQVEKVMADVPAEPVRSHAVQVSATWYPVKQVLERSTGVDRSDFISTSARRVMQKLGFPVRHD